MLILLTGILVALKRLSNTYTLFAEDYYYIQRYTSSKGASYLDSNHAVYTVIVGNFFVHHIGMI